MRTKPSLVICKSTMSPSALVPIVAVWAGGRVISLLTSSAVKRTQMMKYIKSCMTTSSMGVMSGCPSLPVAATAHLPLLGGFDVGRAAGVGGGGHGLRGRRGRLLGVVVHLR